MISETVHENADLSLITGKMKEFIRKARRDVECRATAIQIIKDKVQGRDVDGIANAIYEWIVTRIKYVWDPLEVEFVQDWKNTIGSKAADCDDFTVLAGSLLGCLGIRTRIVLAQTYNSQTWNHVYLEFISRKQWIPFDASQIMSVGWMSKNIIKTKIIEV